MKSWDPKSSRGRQQPCRHRVPYITFLNPLCPEQSLRSPSVRVKASCPPWRLANLQSQEGLRVTKVLPKVSSSHKKRLFLSSQSSLTGKTVKLCKRITDRSGQVKAIEEKSKEGHVALGPSGTWDQELNSPKAFSVNFHIE